MPLIVKLLGTVPLEPGIVTAALSKSPLTLSPLVKPSTPVIPLPSEIITGVLVLLLLIANASPSTVTSSAVLVKEPLRSATFLTLLFSSVSNVTMLSPRTVNCSSTKVNAPSLSVTTAKLAAVLTVARSLRPVIVAISPSATIALTSVPPSSLIAICVPLIVTLSDTTSTVASFKPLIAPSRPSTSVIALSATVNVTACSTISTLIVSSLTKLLDTSCESTT